MIKKILISVSILFFSDFIYCQEVDTIPMYYVSLSQIGDTYTVNDKVVTKNEYEYYFNQHLKASECCPCIVRMYNLGDTLIYEEKRCIGIIDNWFKWYYPNETIKNFGQYSTENKNLKIYSIGIGDKYSKDGIWLSVDIKNDTTNLEIWDNGKYISQFPEIDSSEIWGLKVTYGMKNVRTYNGQISTFKSFNFKPFYKTNNRDAKLLIGLVIMTDGITTWHTDVSVEEFKKLKLKLLAEEKGFQIKENTLIWLTFKSNGAIFGSKIFNTANMR